MRPCRAAACRAASRIVTSLDDLAGVAVPAVVRPAFTLGGHGGGFVSTEQSCAHRSSAACARARSARCWSSVKGWDEFELEVIRDRRDNVVVVCSIENLDPMGVHTGDSVTVAPQMTLADEAYQELRDAAIRRDPRDRRRDGRLQHPVRARAGTGELRVIEMNPRLALLGPRVEGDRLSDREGRGQARRRLHARRDPERPDEDDPGELRADARLRRRQVPALRLREVPRRRHDARDADEVGRRGDGDRRTFQEAFAKAFSSRELDSGAVTWELADLPDDLHPWFRRELELREQGRRRRTRLPARRLVRAGEVAADSNYYYSTRGEADEAPTGSKPRVVILGSGPNRIGQGIEFDYCCVHAAQSFRALGYEAVMVNCNPETVSTDYDTSDRLYFEPLDVESVLAICEREQPEGVVIQFGGQTPLKLARAIEAAGFKVLGTPYEAVDLAEDRERRFGRLLDGLDIRCPDWGIADSANEAATSRSGSATRSSSGRRTCSAAARCGSATTRRRYARRWQASPAPVLVDRFLEGALEIDVDALCGVSVYIGAVMEHVEEAGVHSGDSSCVLPAPSLDEEAYEEVCRVVRRLGPRSASSACSTSSSPWSTGRSPCSR